MAKRGGRSFSQKNARERIKVAAEKLFVQKGFAATKIRDITSQAEVNSALLNYYFGSKEKMLEIIIQESLSKFLEVISEHFNTQSMSIHQKLDFFVTRCIDLLIENPDIPLFIINELNNNQKHLNHNKYPKLQKTTKSIKLFFEELEQMVNANSKTKVDSFQIILNLIGLILFPFIARSMFIGLGEEDGIRDFNCFMEERKKLIPIWIKTIHIKNNILET